MNRELIRAYFRAYRARVTDLEEELGNLYYALDRAEASAHASFDKASALASRMDDELRERQYDQWRLEDEIKQLKRR